MTSHARIAAPERPFVLVLGLNLEDQTSSGHAFDQAMRIASRIAGSEMHIVHVEAERATDEALRKVAGLLELYVSEKAAALRVRGPHHAALHVRRGDPAAEIVRLAAEVGADAIFLGNHRAPHMKSLFVGSTAEHVMAVATCPVFLAGPKPRPEPSHVIVIEAACPDCVQRRAETHGQSWWCARHSEPHHLRRHHVYSYTSELPFATHDSEVSPTGVD
ncbi:MAG TPA: universal stress protein [Polyangiaceae bacterium]|jgi:nucleotide-binding universal stress UspA family protein